MFDLYNINLIDCRIKKMLDYINLVLKVAQEEVNTFKNSDDEDKIKAINKQLDDAREEITTVIRYEIDNNSELADAFVVIFNEFIEEIRQQLNKL